MTSPQKNQNQNQELEQIIKQLGSYSFNDQFDAIIKINMYIQQDHQGFNFYLKQIQQICSNILRNSTGNEQQSDLIFNILIFYDLMLKLFPMETEILIGNDISLILINLGDTQQNVRKQAHSLLLKYIRAYKNADIIIKIFLKTGFQNESYLIYKKEMQMFKKQVNKYFNFLASKQTIRFQGCNPFYSLENNKGTYKINWLTQMARLMPNRIKNKNQNAKEEILNLITQLYMQYPNMIIYNWEKVLKEVSPLLEDEHFQQGGNQIKNIEQNNDSRYSQRTINTMNTSSNTLFQIKNTVFDVSQTSILTSTTVMMIQGSLDPEGDLIVQKLLKKGSDSNTFISEEVKNALIQITMNCSENKISSIILNVDKLLVVLCNYTVDQAVEVRTISKESLLLLLNNILNYSEVDKILQRILPDSLYDWKLKIEFLQKLSEFASNNSETVIKHKHSVKFFDYFAAFINDANTKVQLFALSSFSTILQQIKEGIESNMTTILNSILQCIGSSNSGVKGQGEQLFQAFTQTFDSYILFPYLCNGANYGPARARLNIIKSLQNCVDETYRKKGNNIFVKQINSVIYKLIDENLPELKTQCQSLVQKVYQLIGNQIFEGSNVITRKYIQEIIDK
ncbi:hypothetical protein IMG5_062420 [Ichthyophthirius multifiliis]|uniref:TOG domain-containing protein n=1 Tax=Ichthyophthirius multifiliis TaxID=5932 RepID=G0QNX7_ICHMU|nr:hypothetical protein IMG5_062420 [Ichthyophthirius multifiliis]EGR33064.1 hypothetical protein IMG5_062420 [Ichthyophthirius multifiliis]|eukprot:XP_004037050.1 hypothetical protein IMG5_062420 [Ichthyophthirius multifiliis]